MPYADKSKQKESLAKYEKSPKNQRYRYFQKYSHATEENYKHYVATKNCEICEIEFGGSWFKCQDHNHETKEVRGVLCNGCNTAEGMIRTSTNAMRLVEYMKSHGV